MKLQAIFQAYLDALNQADYESIIQLFAPNATVFSPLYGEQLATSFYRKLLNDTEASEVQLIDIFANDTHRKACLQFLYKWTMNDGSVVRFECVDVVEFDENQKITTLKIIYDTAAARPTFNQLRAK